jgi:hypothetical protein
MKKAAHPGVRGLFCWSWEGQSVLRAARRRATRPITPAPNSIIIGGAGTSVGGPLDVPVVPELVELDPLELDELALLDEELEALDELDEELVEVETLPLELLVELMPEEVLDELPPVDVELPPVEVELPPEDVLLDPPLDVEAVKKALPLEPPKKPPEKKPPPKPPPPLPPTTIAGTPPPLAISTGAGIGIGAGAGKAKVRVVTVRAGCRTMQAAWATRRVR